MDNLFPNQAVTQKKGIDPPPLVKHSVENSSDNHEYSPRHACIVECKKNEADSTAIQLPLFIEIL